jgi:integrase
MPSTLSPNEERCAVSADSTHPDVLGKSSSKPRPDFPLYAHRTGHWAKKVRGQTIYFGRVADDPQGIAAEATWLREKDDRLAGRKPSDDPDALTVAGLVNRFLTHKMHLRDNDELNPRTFQGYHATCATIVKTFGRGRTVADLRPDDFRILRMKLAKGRGVIALRNEMQRVRSVFKFAFDEGLILAPIRFGQSFAKPKQEVIRRAREAHRNEHGDRMFEAGELRKILADAGQPMKAMILLAANCGFGQTDLANLPIRAVNLETSWVDFPRPKTAVPRRCPLWPETIAAIREWVPLRPKAKDKADSGLLFLTTFGQRWVKLNDKGTPSDSLGKEFVKILDTLNLRRSRLSFYGLRHGFETVAGGSKDQVAVDAIMGHVPQGMSAHYRERIEDDRLRAVVEHVRHWLWPETKQPAPVKPQRESKSRAKVARKRTKATRKAQRQRESLVEDRERPMLKLFAG